LLSTTPPRTLLPPISMPIVRAEVGILMLN
jgi:hypothetical protein